MNISNNIKKLEMNKMKNFSNSASQSFDKQEGVIKR